MFNLEKFLFKKIEVWIVLLLIIIFLIFTFAFGVIVHQGLKNRVSLGNISIKFLLSSRVENLNKRSYIYFLVDGLVQDIDSL